MRAGEMKQDGSFSEELMCFVGVFPPEPGLKRPGGLRTLGEGPRRSGPARGCSSVAPICVDISGPHSLFSVSLPAFAKGRNWELTTLPWFQGPCEDSPALSWLDRGSREFTLSC